MVRLRRRRALLCSRCWASAPAANTLKAHTERSFPARKIGALSFAIYIFHLPLFAAIHNITGSRLLACLTAAAATLGAAQLPAGAVGEPPPYLVP